MKMEIYKKLSKIQNELNCPKNLYNSYGKYSYRSCETILESIKPLLEKYKVTLFMLDEIVSMDGRYYVTSIVTLIDLETGEKIENRAFAREEESKKGMDASQITGAASSYSRKYALNGLFLIDDTKDADTDEFSKISQKNQNKIYCEKCNTEITTEKAKNYYLTHPNIPILCFNCNQKK